MTRHFPSVTGKFFFCMEDPAIHYIIQDNAFTRIASWKDHPGYTDIKALSDILQDPNYARLNIVWVMDGNHFCLDLDTKNARLIAEKICAASDVEKYVNMLTEQHANTAEAAAEYTFTEISRSGNGYHIIFDAVEGAFGNKDHYGCAELYKGDHGRFIILTGRQIATTRGEAGADVGSLPPTMLAFIKERFPVVERVPATLPESIYAKEDGSLSSGDPWFWTGQGIHPPVRDVSELRFQFLNALAKQAYGMPSARELIWQAISTSWFATDYTVHNSKNHDRFTRASKILGVKYKEINKALMWAHTDAVKMKRDSANNEALLRPLLDNSKLKFEQNLTAEREVALSRVSAMSKSPEKLVFPPFPVDIFNQYADWAASSVLSTEKTITRTAALAHLTQLVSRRFATPTGSLLNLYTAVLATQGHGKEVLSSAFNRMQTQIDSNATALPLPQSTIALHKKTVERPNGLLILKEFGDRLREWVKIGSANGSTPRFLKDLWGTNAGDSIAGASYSDAAKDLPPIQNPALNVLAEGTREQVLDAFGMYGMNDGFLARWLIIEAGTDWVDTWEPVIDLPQQLCDFLSSVNKYCTGLPSMPTQPQRVQWTQSAETILRWVWSEQTTHARAVNGPTEQYPFWRGAYQNALKLASVMAVYDHMMKGLEGVPVIEEPHAVWARDVVLYSVQNGVGHFDNECAFGTADEKAASDLRDMIDKFFTYPQTAVAAARLQGEGHFSVGYLGRKKRGLTDHPKGLSTALDIGIKLLLQDGIIEFADEGPRKGARAGPGKGPALYRIGENWSKGQRIEGNWVKGVWHPKSI